MLRTISIIFIVFSIFIAGLINAIDYKFKRHVLINGPFAAEVSGTHSLWVDLRPEIPFSNLLLFGEKIFSSYGDTLENQDRSKLQLKVNGNQLIFPHALHATIRKQGNGAFSHWGDVLIFSLPQGVENASSTCLDINFKTLNPMLYRLVLLISFLLIIGSSFYLFFDFLKLHYYKSKKRLKQLDILEILRENKTAYMPHLDGLRAVGRKLLDVPGYTYRVWVTSRTESAVEIWRDYNGRAIAVLNVIFHLGIQVLILLISFSLLNFRIDNQPVFIYFLFEFLNFAQEHI